MRAKLIAAAMAALACAPAPAGGSERALSGTWTLVSSIAEKDGRATDQFGPAAKGMMILDDHGHFMLTIIGAGLPRFTSGNRAAGTPEENKAVVSKSIAIFGTWSQDLTQGTLLLKIDQSTFPNWNATEQHRSVVELTGGELKYRTAQASGGGSATVTWARVR